MDPRLKKLDASAGTPNTFLELSMPMVSAARETSRINGYMIWVRKIVVSASAGEKPGARMPIICFANRMPRRLTALISTIVRVMTFDASAQADSSPSVAIFLENMVINEIDSAPSANKSRSRLGARNAIRKTPIDEVPKNELNNTSRIRPRKRLNKTAMPIMPVAFTFKVLSLLFMCHVRENQESCILYDFGSGVNKAEGNTERLCPRWHRSK